MDNTLDNTLAKLKPSLYKAFVAKDPRYDGKFFIGVKTTKIYCRPICPATPKFENIVLFQTSLAAEEAGFRACLRCRPECSPQSPAWIGKQALVQRVMKVLNSENIFESKDEELFAERFGITARHLRRLFQDEFGKTPQQIADMHRLNFAKRLVVETNLPMTEIALTSGFNSIRRFNDAFKNKFRQSPTDLRKNRKTKIVDSVFKFNLSYRPPFDFESHLSFLSSHGLYGLEEVSNNTYKRYFSFPPNMGYFIAANNPKKSQLELEIHFDDHKYLRTIIQNVRQMFDLDSDPRQIEDHYKQNDLLKKLVKSYPGLRIPRGWDPFETAIYTILGQLVSTQQANALVRQLIETYGSEAIHHGTGHKVKLFPTAAQLSAADLTALRTTQKRKETIKSFSSLVADKKLNLHLSTDLEKLRESLLAISGIGPWTAEYLCMRALGDNDAFPGSDLILKRALALYPKLILDQFRPWRGYLAILLWKEYATKLSNKKAAKK